MKKISRNWSKQEDQILTQIMIDEMKKKYDKLKWEQIAIILQGRFQSQKTGKQCRQRWHNQLAPQSSYRGQWTNQQNEILFDLNDKYGNKWAKIAQQIPGRTDNTVKNHFYSTMRRGLRKLNTYIHNVKRKHSAVKQFKQQILNKILIIVDGDQNDKLDVKNNAFSLSKVIKKNLSIISLDIDDTDETNHQLKQKLFRQILEFSKSCKRKKAKKVGILSSGSEVQSSQPQIQQIISKKSKNKQKSYEQTTMKQEQDYKMELNKVACLDNVYDKQVWSSVTSIKNKNNCIESVGNVNNNISIGFDNNPMNIFDFNKDKRSFEFPQNSQVNDKVPFNIKSILESPRPQLRTFIYNVTPGTPSPFSFNNINMTTAMNNFIFHPIQEPVEEDYVEKNRYQKQNQ